MNQEMMNLFASASVVSAAQETGLVRELGAGPLAAEAYAERLGLDPRATGLVLDILAAIGVAEKRDGLYDGSPDLRAMLAARGPMPISVESFWSHTGQFLRTGKPFLRMDASPAQREASYSGAVTMLAQFFEHTARELARRIEPAPARVLDVGCGSGVWGLAFAEHSPTTHVTGLDFPAVLEAFTARATTLGVAERTATLPGNMHEAKVPEGAFDLVVIANVLRLEPRERAAALLARLAPAVAPGGSLLVVDALAGGTPEREKARAFYALNLALRTEQGRVHSPGEISAWLADAGFSSIQPVDLGVHPGAVGALLARK